MDVDELLEKMSDTMRNKREKWTDEPEFLQSSQKNPFTPKNPSFRYDQREKGG